MKVLKIVLFYMGIFLLFQIFSALNLYGQETKVRVIKEGAVLRLKPESESIIINNLPLGAFLDAEETIGEWVKVKLPPDKNGVVVTGYILSSFVEFEKIEKAVEKIQRAIVKKEIKPIEVEVSPKLAKPKPTPMLRRYHLILSGGVGFGFNITKKAIEGYPETTFGSGQSIHSSIRVGSFKKDEAFCLDISYYQLTMPLKENGTHFGDLTSKCVVISPGFQTLNPKAGGFGIFAGLIGLGYAMNTFAKGDIIALFDVSVENSLIFSLFPIKFDYFLMKNVAIGAGFAILGYNTGTKWKIDGYQISDVNKLFSSNTHLYAHLSLAF